MNSVKGGGVPHVAILVETSMAYGREMLSGVAEYIQKHEPWSIYFEQRSLEDPAPPWLSGWEGDGIITRLSPRISEVVLQLGIPTVNVDDQTPTADLPNVQSDQVAIGALAAVHLIEQGFKRLAFVGHPHFEWSLRRRDGFVRAALDAGCSCAEYYSENPVSWGHQQASWEQETENLSRWLAAQPKPVGLMACNDSVGVQVLDACRRAGLTSPDEVGVVGVDDDVLACEFAHPPLTSIIPACRRIGYEAAAMLHLLMERRPLAERRRDVPPIGIAVRQSTDVTKKIGDPLVAKALRFVRERACESIRVDDVLAHVGASRSVLQRRFRLSLGRSIHETIAAARLERVKQLLVETDLPLTDVALQTGFSHAEYLSAVFRREAGMTPGAFRRENRKPCRHL